MAYRQGKECEKQVRQERKRIASPFPGENHVSSKQKRVTPPPQYTQASSPERKRAALPPPLQRPSQVKSICTAADMSRIGPPDLQNLASVLGVDTAVDGGSKQHSIAEVSIELAEKMNGGQHASFVPSYLKFPIERVTGMKGREGETFYSVTYKMPDCPGESWLTVKDILLYGGEKELDTFLLDSDLLPLFSADRDAKSGSALLAEMKAAVDNTTVVLQEIAGEEGVEMALDVLTRASRKLAEIPTTARCEVKRVRKGPGRAASKRAWKSAKAEAYAVLNEKQLEMLAALDDAWSKIRIALVSVDNFARLGEQLLSIALG